MEMEILSYHQIRHQGHTKQKAEYQPSDYMHFYPPQGFVCGYIWVNIGPTHFIRPKGMDWSEHDFVVNAKQQI